MKISIENKIVKRVGRKGVFTHSESGKIKTGFLINDENGKNIGIVFKSDDTQNKSAYGQSEILFDEDFEKEFKRTWYKIRINKKPLPYKHLEEIMYKNEHYVINMDLKI